MSEDLVEGSRGQGETESERQARINKMRWQAALAAMATIGHTEWFLEPRTCAQRCFDRAECMLTEHERRESK